jgi:phospholipase C
LTTRKLWVVTRIVVFVQENKTTDFYFPTLAAWGADVQPYGSLLEAPPDFDQPHDRNAWVHYAMGDYPGVQLSIDNDSVIPYYSWLAKTYTFCDHHFGAGSDSTSGHLLTFAGQTPTFRNPPSRQQPVWDIPTVFRLAERAGHSWGAFVGPDEYPVHYVAELSDPTAQPNVHPSGSFVTLAQAGTLPDLCYVWSPNGYDEHPPTSGNAPGYIGIGQDLVWREIDAVVAGGGWSDSVFILTWDDWGGYADHLPTPAIETLPDALHPDGYQAIGGSRIPLVMFGSHVKQAIETQWHSHASIAKTAIDILGLPALGVHRVDQAPTLVGQIDPSLSRPAPPAPGSAIVQPASPEPRPVPEPTSPWSGPLNTPMPSIILNGGGTLPPPSDGTVSAQPPRLPQ